MSGETFELAWGARCKLDLDFEPAGRLLAIHIDFDIIDRELNQQSMLVTKLTNDPMLAYRRHNAW